MTGENSAPTAPAPFGHAGEACRRMVRTAGRRLPGDYRGHHPANQSTDCPRNAYAMLISEAVLTV